MASKYPQSPPCRTCRKLPDMNGFSTIKCRCYDIQVPADTSRPTSPPPPRKARNG